MKYNLLKSAEQVLSFFSVEVPPESGEANARNVVNGRRYHHHPFCNYQMEQMDWCNCGITQLRIAVEAEHNKPSVKKRRRWPDFIKIDVNGTLNVFQKLEDGRRHLYKSPFGELVKLVISDNDSFVVKAGKFADNVADPIGYDVYIQILNAVYEDLYKSEETQ